MKKSLLTCLLIIEVKSFNSLISFLKEVGYEKVDSRLYEGKRHELLNEIGKEAIYQDILDFVDR